MPFDFNQDLETMMDMFANADVSITLSGVLVKSIRGIFDQTNEVVSPFEADRLTTSSMLTVLDADFAGTTSAHVLTITKDDGSVTAREYKFNGKPRPDGAGLTIIYLEKK